MVQSIERAIAILKCFEAKPHLRLTEISNLVGLNKTTTYNLVQTLEYCGFLDQDQSQKTYSVGGELFRLGSLYHKDLLDVIYPIMQTLAATTGETVNLVARRNGRPIYLEKIESKYSVRTCTVVGQECDLFLTSAGKAIIAYEPQEIIDKRIEEYEPYARTKYTITSKDELRRELALVRKRGYAEDNQEAEYGVRCVAIPIFNRQKECIAAVSISGPTVRVTEEKKEEYILLLNESFAPLQSRL